MDHRPPPSDFESEFEAALARREPGTLPPEWKEEIIGNAAVATRSEPRSIVPLLLPKAVALPLAAAWIAIIALRVSVPGPGPTAATQVPAAALAPAETNQGLVAWMATRNSLARGEEPGSLGAL